MITRSGAMLRRSSAIPLAMALLLCTACRQRQENPSAAFPASNDVSGWVMTSSVRTYEAADLWKYIDGEVEKYLKAGVQHGSTADYKFQDKIEVVADIYTMSNADGAAQIFNSELAGDAKSVQVGDAARLFTQSLVFRQGRYLVRLVAYQESPDAPQALVALGQGINQRLSH
jgi:hypothetical protein